MIPKKTIIFVGVLLGLAYYNYRSQRLNDTSNSLLTNIIGGAVNIFNGGKMKTSTHGQHLIEQREEYRNVVYADAVGNPTGGIGHLLTRGDGLSIGDSIPDTTIQAWFASDISHAENIIARYITVTLTQNELDALVSAVFNLGSRFFINPDSSKTMVLQYINSGNMRAAAAQFPRWDHAGGMTIAGLESRRIEEMQQFLA